MVKREDRLDQTSHSPSQLTLPETISSVGSMKASISSGLRLFDVRHASYYPNYLRLGSVSWTNKSDLNDRSRVLESMERTALLWLSTAREAMRMGVALSLR